MLLMGAGVKRSIGKVTKQSAAKTHKREICDNVSTVIEMMSTIAKDIAVFHTIRTRVADIASGHLSIDTLLQSMTIEGLIDLQSAMVATTNSDRKMVILTESLMSSEIEGLDRLKAHIETLKESLITIIDQATRVRLSNSSSSDRRNLAGLMDLVASAIRKKLGKDGTDDEDVSELVERLRKL
jgi:hypothetical protein